MKIFVFGSNLAGRHGAGSALYAKKYYGALYGHGVGICNQSYAIPTKDKNLKTLSLERINTYVLDFIKYAYEHPEDEFEVVKIGCGLAGYAESEIAPMFINAPSNCKLPKHWREF